MRTRITEQIILFNCSIIKNTIKKQLKRYFFLQGQPIMADVELLSVCVVSNVGISLKIFWHLSSS